MAVPVAFFLQNREIHGPCSATGEKGDWSSVDDCNRCFQMIRKWAIHPTCRMRIYVDLDLFFLKSSLCESAMIYMEPHIYIQYYIYREIHIFLKSHRHDSRWLGHLMHLHHSQSFSGKTHNISSRWAHSWGQSFTWGGLRPIWWTSFFSNVFCRLRILGFGRQGPRRYTRGCGPGRNRHGWY